MPDEVPDGTRIVDMNNNDITKIRTSPNGASYAGQFKVLYPKDSVNDQTGAVQMSLHANVYKYAIYYAVRGNQQIRHLATVYVRHRPYH